MIGLAVVLLSGAALLVVFEVGRRVWVAEVAARCPGCEGSGRGMQGCCVVCDGSGLRAWERPIR